MKLSGKVLFNRIVIKKIEIEKVSKSGIILPNSKNEEDNNWDGYEDHPLQGIVIAKGGSVTVCEEGDVVLLRSGCMSYGLVDKGTLYMVIQESDILVVRENGSTE